MITVTVTISKILIVILDTTQYTVISNFFKCIIVINMNNIPNSCSIDEHTHTDALQGLASAPYLKPLWSADLARIAGFTPHESPGHIVIP